MSLKSHREMRGAAMSLTAASGGFVVLLTVTVIQGQSDWGVTYTHNHICGLKGSTVEMNCSYRYPYMINDHVTTVEETFWFTKWINNAAVDLNNDPDYTGRVEYHCKENFCSLRIRDLRQSDSAEYKFRFITNQPGGKYAGEPGVTLSVTDLQVLVERSSTQTVLKCLSTPYLPDHRPYVWYKDGQKMKQEPFSLRVSLNDDSSYSCALKRCEDHHSPPVYPPKLPSVSVSPSGEIVEGSSVTLTCSSDANPAAKYTWYKENDRKFYHQQTQLVFSSIQPSESGEYYCGAENEMGWRRSVKIFIDVKYPPKLPSVSVSPSGEIVEGSSVTLTCSSDANPAAKYTWYKENEDSPKASGQIFTITDFRPGHSGNYYCEAQNTRGRHSSTLNLTVVTGKSAIIMNIIRLTLIVLMPIPLLVLNLWTRKKKTLSLNTELNEAVEMMEVDSGPDYENTTTAAQTQDTEEQEDLV